MEVMLGFLFVVFVTSMRSVDRETSSRQSAVILVASVIVAVSLLSHRVA